MGSAYDFIRNNAADAKNYFYNPVSTPRKPQLVQNQYGGSFGGPIKRDKLFFFAAYEGRHTKSSAYNRDPGAHSTRAQRRLFAVGLSRL